ncbi:MAG: protein kinase [Bacteroidales bacterium]|nr:protein kinase [Bacteroidales bacterium]
MADNNENTLGSGFITDSGQTGGADLGSGFVTSAEPSSNAPQTGANALANTFTDIKELSVQGAMSTVYQGKKYGKWHIIKRIKPQFKDNPQYRELFMKEFDNGVQLDHPNIVRFEDKGEDAEGLWYTMEYVDGRPLSDLIKTGELIKNERLTRSIITQLCDALTYVHKKQIVHRDLKPDNILVTYRGDNVKVLDFGLAYSDSYDDHLVKAGTPKYAAPEQMTKGNLVDQRADIYAVGMILLEMCTGSLVDKTASTVQNPNFKLVINRATQADPDQRYHDCREILEDLNSTIVTGTSLQQTHAAEVKPAARPAETPVEGERKKNMLPLILGIVAAAVVIGIVIFFLMRKGDTPNTPDNPVADNTEQQTTKPQKPEDNGGKDNAKPVDEPKQNNSPTEEEKKQNEEQSALKEEYERLLSEAKKVFDTKNVARALPLYEAIVKKQPAYAEAQNEAAEKVKFCNEQINKYGLYTLTKDYENGNSGVFGYKNKDGYIVVDYRYYDDKPNKDGYKKLLAVKDASGKWGLIDDMTKREVTDFEYIHIINRIDGSYTMYITKNPNDPKMGRWDVIEVKSGKVVKTKFKDKKEIK